MWDFIQIPPSTSQENIRVHLCVTCVSLYQWGWLFIPPPPEQKMNHELRWQDSRSTGCEQFPKELKHCLTCKWKLNANNFRLHSTETEERQHVKSYLEKCILLFNLMPATHSRKLQFGTHFPLQILVFRKYSEVFGNWQDQIAATNYSQPPYPCFCLLMLQMFSIGDWSWLWIGHLQLCQGVVIRAERGLTVLLGIIVLLSDPVLPRFTC